MIGSNTASPLPLHGLRKFAFDAIILEFRQELERGEFSDTRPTHGVVFRYGAERTADLRAVLEEIAAVEAPFAMPEAVPAAPARL